MIKVLEIPQYSQPMDWILDQFDHNREYPSFTHASKRFPDFIRQVGKNQEPRWGCAWYIKDTEGRLKVWKQNWDSSG